MFYEIDLRMFKNVYTKRTDNGPESFHSHFNDQFYCAHPCIYVFIDVLKQIQTTTYIKIKCEK
jgi:hypothetical protein